jgi:hypothetical protein
MRGWKRGLAIVTNAGFSDEGDFGHERRVESEVDCERGFLAETNIVDLRRLRARSMQVVRHPRESAIDIFVANDLIDLPNRRKPCVPCGLRMVTAEGLHQLRKPRVGDHRQVRGRVARIDSGAPIPFEYGYGSSGTRKQVRCRQSGDSAADDGHVDMLVTVNFGESRE